MIVTNAADIYQELEIRYYEEGILIKSLLNIESKENDKRNYEIPIIIVANNTFGFKVIHGLQSYTIFKRDFLEMIFNKSILMMNNSNNWWVFVPTTQNLALEEIISKLQRMHNAKLSLYSVDNYKQTIDYNNKRSSLAFGLGVE